MEYFFTFERNCLYTDSMAMIGNSVGVISEERDFWQSIIAILAVHRTCLHMNQNGDNPNVLINVQNTKWLMILTSSKSMCIRESKNFEIEKEKLMITYTHWHFVDNKIFQRRSWFVALALKKVETFEKFTPEKFRRSVYHHRQLRD